jgi:Leucine-rich repeat (LRR) protein
MRLILIILSTTLFFNCKVDTREQSLILNTDTTTVYSISTRELQSNEIPEIVFRMSQLRRLSITGMDCDYRESDENGNDITKCWAIREIPAEIQSLTNLEILELRVNSIQTVPIEIGKLKKLKALDLTDNPGLSNIDHVVQLAELQELYLYGCSLIKLPDNIGQLKKLKHLALTGNNIDSTERERITTALPTTDIQF